MCGRVGGGVVQVARKAVVRTRGRSVQLLVVVVVVVSAVVPVVDPDECSVLPAG